MKYLPGLSHDTKPLSWAAALETERRCFSQVILASNVTPNITRSEDSLAQFHLESMGLTEEELCVTWRLS